MAINGRRMHSYRTPEVEVIRINPPKDHSRERRETNDGREIVNKKPGFLNLFKNINFDMEDILLIALMLLFLNMDDDDYIMMIPALIYIFMG